MIKRFAIIFSLILTTLASQAFEDCIITTDGKLTNINIEDNTVVDVFPLVTVMNDKNTLIVHPLKQGQTRFCVLKNDKHLALFNVSVYELETEIEAPDGYEVLTLDAPNNLFEFELDEPPMINNSAKKEQIKSGE